VSLVKTVELRVLTDAGDAQAKLDELDAKAKDLEASDIKMRFRIDDAGGKAQLDDLRAKADKLGFKDVSIKVRVDGAGRAVAELAAVRREEEKAASGGLLSKIGSFLGGGGPMGGGGGMGAAGPIPVPALLAVVPAIGAALVEVTGLASGFAAAGAGAGAFYLLAHPAISNLTSDVKALGAANQAQGIAQQKENIDPTKAHAKAVSAANLQYQATFAQMGQDAGPAAAGILKLHDSYVKLSTAFQPAAFKVFNGALKVANNLLPAAAPFANTFATSLDGLLKKADKFTQSKGFGDFLKQFRSIEGPAVTAIGDGIGKVANSVGKLLTTMNGKDVAASIGIAFNVISGSISAVSFVVRRLMQNWDGMSGAAKAVARAVASAFDSLVGSAEATYHGVMSAWHSMISGIVSVAGSIISTVAGLPGRINSALGGLPGMMLRAGVNVINSLISGIESGIGKLGSVVAGIARKVAGFFGLSPAVEGPLSGGGAPEIRGQHFAGDITRGMLSGVPGVASAASRLAGAAAIGPAGARGGYGSGGQGGDHVELHFHGVTTDQGTVRQLVQVIREYKRHGGGAALGIA
jgi:hypothetical protein